MSHSSISVQTEDEVRGRWWIWAAVFRCLATLMMTYFEPLCSTGIAAEELDFLVPVPDSLSNRTTDADPAASAPSFLQVTPVPIGTRPAARQSPIDPGHPVARFATVEPVTQVADSSEHFTPSLRPCAGACGASGERECRCWHCCSETGLVHFRAEHLQWWSSGMRLPPLATFSPAGTPVNQAGVLGLPTTSILIGGEKIFDQSMPGGRYTVTYWWDQCSPLGIEAEYFGIFHAGQVFQAGAPADIVSRPFINALGGLEDAQLVSFPGLLEGTTTASAHTELHSAAARFRFDFYHRNSSTEVEWKERHSIRWTAFLGYRFAHLDEDLTIGEDLTDPAAPATDFDIRDSFETENHFHGGELGLAGEFEDGRWSLDLDARLSLGNHRQRVGIDGSTVITALGVAQSFQGGLLTQSTNIGTFERDRFALIPEFGASLGYRLHENVRVVAGYRLFFWSNVVRPGDQIDRVVNPNLLAPSVPPVAGPQRPRFAFQEDDFLGQALSFGVEINW